MLVGIASGIIQLYTQAGYRLMVGPGPVRPPRDTHPKQSYNINYYICIYFVQIIITIIIIIIRFLSKEPNEKTIVRQLQNIFQIFIMYK